ncbi:GNAT family N-acetyltransferase [Gracilibacillus timonensis]|uniref:GNAT family N-acetyltransferase n=1 Tax=Gracilibacillus timonensis TaxID=1816696 RepID=UPI0008264881|nr:N-acetyltransferase [Gracilibacillus timonensis]
MHYTIRQETETDYAETERIVKQAFADETYSDQTEHVLVHKIRQTEAFVPELSFVAFNETNEIVGQVLLSKITIGAFHTPSLALAPVSVLPAYQGQGIGSKLIGTSLQKAAKLGYSSVIVLGHPDYYPRFGFAPASKWEITAPFAVEDEAFMAVELIQGGLTNTQGVVQYSAPFDQ